MTTDAVVLVHGIWMTGWDLKLLARRLQKQGFTPYIFRYPSLHGSPAENAERLWHFVAEIEAERIHFVGHSLGGIVLMHFFSRYNVSNVGQTVLLGSPLRGSIVAERLMRFPRIGRYLLGRSIESGLLGGVPPWEQQTALGLIIGSRSIGVGQCLGRMCGVNDGTVLAVEAAIDETDHIHYLPVSHMGLVFKACVVPWITRFLQDASWSESDVKAES